MSSSDQPINAPTGQNTNEAVPHQGTEMALDETNTGGDSQNNQNNGHGGPQETLLMRDRMHQQHQQRAAPGGMQGSLFNTHPHVAANARGGMGHQHRGGHQGRGGHRGRGGHQNQGGPPAPNNPTKQQVVRAQQQTLGKTSRDNNDEGSSGRNLVPFFRPDEYTYDTTDSAGKVVGFRPVDPQKDGTNVVVRNPRGTGLSFQVDGLSQGGCDVVSQLVQAAALSSSTGRVRGIIAPADDIGLGNNLDRVGVSSIGQPADALPLHMLQGYGAQNQNRPQNQCQGQAQPVLCILCNSRIHPTGQCPIPSSYHHGDTAVCGVHNTTNRYPQKGHIFDCSVSKPYANCPDVQNAQNGIWRREDGEKEHWEFLIKWLVVERQRKAPIRVEDLTLDFVALVIDYSTKYCNGQMPPQVNGRWPYTKAEVRPYDSNLRRYDELGPDQMPAGMLEGKEMTEIRAMRERGDIPYQVYGKHDAPATNPQPAGPATGANQVPVPDQQPTENNGNAGQQPAPDSNTTPTVTGDGASAANNTDMEEFLAGAQNASGDTTETQLSIDYDVAWHDIPESLRPLLDCVLINPNCDPNAVWLIQCAKNGKLMVTKSAFQERLHNFAAAKKLPHTVIKGLKEHWPMEKKA